MRRASGGGRRGTRRGSALILVLLMTLAVAALAVAAIFMSSSAGLLSRFYDRERQFSYAAESALEQAISKLQLDASFAVSSTTPMSVISLTDLYDASGAAIAGAKVQVWGALTGDTTSSGPITVTLLAQVSDVVGTRFVRRVDLQRDNLAHYTFISNSATTPTTLPFRTNTAIVGRIHANGDWSRINNSSYRDSISSTGIVDANIASLFKTGSEDGARVVRWPDADQLLDSLDAKAADLGLAFDAAVGQHTRVEFVWRDLDGDGVAGSEEGFVRVFDLEHAEAKRVEGEPAGFDYYAWNDPVIQNQCGAHYKRNGRWQFFPVAVHQAAWAWSIIDSAAGVPARPSPSNWSGDDDAKRDATRAIVALQTARCFAAGSPQLVNTERFADASGTLYSGFGSAAGFTYPFGAHAGSPRYGGDDTTFTQVALTCTIGSAGTCTADPVPLGAWRSLSSDPGNESLAPLERNGVGAVVSMRGDAYVNGFVAGRVSLAVDGWAGIVDRILHAGGPNAESSDCSHLFGLAARDSIQIQRSPITHRSRVGSGFQPSRSTFASLGSAARFELQGAYLSLSSHFGVEGSGFSHGNDGHSCEGVNFSIGCVRHSGSAAMQTTRMFSTGNNVGGRYVLTPDACFERGYRPPFWPGTNRYSIIRALDVRTRLVIGNGAIAAYFASLQGT